MVDEQVKPINHLNKTLIMFIYLLVVVSQEKTKEIEFFDQLWDDFEEILKKLSSSAISR